MPRSRAGFTPHDHAVSFYADDADVVAQVVGFVAGGLGDDEPALVVGTQAHTTAIDQALRERGIDPDAARAQGRYICADAAATLDLFMRAGQPDPALFAATVGGLLDTAAAGGSNVRVFGEMVALLWHDDQVNAALAVEGLWNTLAETRSFTLLCAYPTEVVQTSRLTELYRVCGLHSQVAPCPSTAFSFPTSPAATEAGETNQRSRVFVPTPDAVGAARRFAATTLTDWGHHELSGDVALVVSELATNAVRHARSPFLVFVHDQPGEVLLVGVKDATSRRPARQSPGGQDAGGRGLLPVDALARRWGWDRLPDGKLVWAEFRLAPEPCPVPAPRQASTPQRHAVIGHKPGVPAS